MAQCTESGVISAVPGHLYPLLYGMHAMKPVTDSRIPIYVLLIGRVAAQLHATTVGEDTTSIGLLK